MRTLLLTLALALGCGRAADAPLYLHNREDYQRFRARAPELLEPNYLPFMAARVTLPAEDGAIVPWRWLAALLREEGPPQELLVFCRWPDDAFPLKVHVVSPEIPARFGDRLFPRPPAEYVAAVERALARWETGLEGRVRFARAESAAGADLTIELRGEEAPTPDPSVQVLGATPLGDACRVEGVAGEGRLDVRYRVSELRVFVADQHGLLLPEQVERIALHELGHALGMHGHSPIPNDLMFRVLRDRLPRDELGAEDVNSFVSLYAIPNGTVYAALPTQEPVGTEPARAPEGPPVLSLAPHVDARLGYEVQLPAGWTRVAMQQGVVAVDGVTWDYTASFQILVRAYPSLHDYLARYADAHLGGGELLGQRTVEVAGLPGVRFLFEPRDTGYLEELIFLESGDGRVVVAIAESPAALHDAYLPFFEAILDSLELHAGGPRAADREYGPGPGRGGGRAPR